VSVRGGAARRAVAAAAASWPRSAPAPRERPRPVRPQARPAPARARTRPRRARIRLGLAVIPLIALLLGGIVWIAGAQLALTNQTSELAQKYQQVQAEARRLQAEVAQYEGSVAAEAAERLGMVQAPSNAVTYLTAPPRSP